MKKYINRIQSIFESKVQFKMQLYIQPQLFNLRLHCAVDIKHPMFDLKMNKNTLVISSPLSDLMSQQNVLGDMKRIPPYRQLKASPLFIYISLKSFIIVFNQVFFGLPFYFISSQDTVTLPHYYMFWSAIYVTKPSRGFRPIYFQLVLPLDYHQTLIPSFLVLSFLFLPLIRLSILIYVTFILSTWFFIAQHLEPESMVSLKIVL